jgi:triosephosphate isomerase
MRFPLIAGNWKMNTTVNQAISLARELRRGLDEVRTVEKVLCPPFVSLAAVKDVVKGTSIKMGAQNLYFEEKGAYTGEISPEMLAELCVFVIIGHSERRQYFSETDEIVNKKVRAALKFGLRPILCIGEKLEENEAGKTEAVVTGQLKASLAGIDYSNKLVIAYEPVWAIGTGKAATSQQANDTIGLIRRTISGLYSSKAADEIHILYGGSVSADNANDLMKQPEIDGALVGGASLKASDFISIVRQTAQVKK